MEKLYLVLIIYLSGVVISFIGYVINRKTKWIEHKQYDRFFVLWSSLLSWVLVVITIITSLSEGKLNKIKCIFTPFAIIGDWFNKEF